MQKKIQSALISVFYKDGLDSLAKKLQALNVTIYSTGGTQKFLEDNNITCAPVESLTTYPSILGGRVKTLHPVIFGGILGKRDDAQHVQEMNDYKIPEIDLVIVDLYPFEETVKSTSDEKQIIEKIDIGGPSMIRAAAKNFKDVTVIAAKDDYAVLENILTEQNGETNLEQRKNFAAKAFQVVMNYDIAINNYFNPDIAAVQTSSIKQVLRYGENPHQKATFYGDLKELFTQLNGKELSYNNLVDVDAALQLINEFKAPSSQEFQEATFAIIKHTNVCGIAQRDTVKTAWDAALAGDPESAFGGVLVTNGTIDKATAEAINEIFFEVLIAPAFDEDALQILKSKKNRILLQAHSSQSIVHSQTKSLLNGTLTQDFDNGNFTEWKEVGGRETSQGEKDDLSFANLVCKHLKSNAIALVKHKQLVGKGCGQTSRIDSLRQAIDKAKQFNFNLNKAVLASDAFFPFNDCVQIAHAAGIEAFIQPGGSIRDKDSIDYCVENKLVSASLFLCVRCIDFIKREKQQKIIVYNVPQHKAIDIIEGRNYQFIGDSILQEDGFLRNFHLQPSRIKHRIKPVNSVQSASIQQQLIQVNDKSFLIIDNNRFFKKLQQKIKVNAVIISGNPKLYLNDMIKYFDCEIIIADATNPLWKINKWKKDAEQLHLSLHSVPDDGAFEMNL